MPLPLPGEPDLVLAGLGGPVSEPNIPSPPLSAPDAVRVEIATDFGPILVDLLPGAAPGTVANFLGYVDQGWYDGGRFHRVVTMENQPSDTVRIEVIQGGGPEDRMNEPQPAIPLERTTVTGLAHKHGTISMARFTPDSAKTDFFICINDQPELDFGGTRNPDGQGFAAFGQVIAGMDVVAQIQQQPASGQSLTPPVPIERIRRIPVS